MEETTWSGGDLGPLLDRAERLLERASRSVLGIAGAPASGKSTLSAALVTALGQRHPEEVVLVGMDAFHLGHQVLVRRGLVGVKGAPHTFDALGFAALLQRIRESAETVYAPEFHREIEDSLAAVVEIGPQVRLVVTEGNYLLLPQSPWDRVRPLLDEAWFVHLDDEERQRRMVARHLHFGHSPEMANAKTFGSDENNARLVNSQQNRPDLWIEQRP
ncbi:MAG TPA: nucleoside/nucleotide kinase family protein [Propionibacteriaceae bacterium]